MYAIFNHLWQSTLFALLIWLVTLALRKNGANVRYALWMAASLKFLLPFSWLAAVAALISWPFDIGAVYQMPLPVALLGAPLVASATDKAVLVSVQPSSWSQAATWLMLALWAGGSIALVCRGLRRWTALQTAIDNSTPVQIDFPIAVRASPTQLEPGVIGLFRPVLLVPQNIQEHLTPAQLQAVLVHEYCHIERRDNLTAALHMLVEVVFWFFPLVWWIGAKLINEREHACDEKVLSVGHSPQSYAEAILQICQLYLESPVACVAGVSGANLKRRIESIMNHEAKFGLSLMRKSALIALAAAVVAVPIVAGLASASRAHAVTTPAAPKIVNDRYSISLEKVLESVSKNTHQHFVVDLDGEGMLHSYGIDQKTIDYPLLLTVLANNGLTAVETQGVYHVIPLSNVRTYPVPTIVGNDASIPDDEVVTKVIALKHASADSMVMGLRPLIPVWGHLHASGASSLILVDRYANVRRIEALVQTLDVDDNIAK